MGSRHRHEFEIGLSLFASGIANHGCGKVRQDRQHLVDLWLHRQRHARQLRHRQSRLAVFTKSLALEHVKDGLNINAIAPGRIKTDKVRGHYSNEAWAAAEAQIPMGRAGAPEDIASAALFLVNDENKYITGQTIHVNGAW